MQKQRHTIKNVPMYFTPYTHDCFQNAYGSIVSYLGLNPDIILADYLSFVYDRKFGYAGVNYVLKSGTTVEFSEEELNVALEYVKFDPTTYFSNRTENTSENIQNDRINIFWYIDDDNDVALSRMKELVDNDIPVVVIVDMYYMKYHKAYHKEHGLHAVIITGYDEEENYVELFDKYRLSNSDFEGRIPMDELILARCSDNRSGDYSRPIRNLWMEFVKVDNFTYSDDKWKAVIKESCRRMMGKTKVLDLDCGLDSLEQFRVDLLAKKSEKFDSELANLFRFYYSTVFRILSRSRKRFSAFINTIGSQLPENMLNEITTQLMESAKCWEINANLIIRLSITKKMDSLDQIDEQFKLILKYEKAVVDNLYNFIQNMPQGEEINL